MAATNIGSLVYSVEMQTAKFVAGSKATKAEFNQLRKIAKDTGGPLAKLQGDFATLVKVGREAGKSLDVAAISFGKLSASQKGAGQTTRKFISDLKMERQILRERVAFGDVLSKADKAWLAQLNRQIPVFERSAQAARKSAAAEKRLELQKRRATRAAKEQAEADRKAEIQREKQAKAANRAAREFAAAQTKAKAAIVARLSPQRKLVHAMRVLREEHRKGIITTNEYTAALRNLERQLRKMRAANQQQQTQQRTARRSLNGITTGMIGLARQIALVTVGYKLLRTVTKAFQDSLELGRVEKQFEIFTGSQEVASNLVNELRQLSATTPLTVESTTQATKTMLQYGVAQGVVTEKLRQLGDVSGGSHETLQRLSLAFGQITANGRLQGQELRQLIEGGFNPLQEISRKTGESMLSLRDKMADGAISAQMVSDALESATSKGGRFANQMDKIANETAFGKLQVLAGQFQLWMVDQAETMADAIADKIEPFTEWFAEQNERSTRSAEARKNVTAEETALYWQMLEAKRQELGIAGRLATLASPFQELFGGGTIESDVHDMWAIMIANRRREADMVNEQKREQEELRKQQEETDQARLASLDEIRQKYRKQIQEMKFSEQELEDQRIKTMMAGMSPKARKAFLADLQAQRQELEMLKEKEKQQEHDQEYWEDWNDFTENLQEQNRKAAKEAKEEREEALQNIKDRAQAHKDLLDKNHEHKELLKEIALLEEHGFLSAEDAASRREMAKKEFLDKNKKESRERTAAAAGGGRNSKEEYKILRNITNENRARKEEAAHRRKMELHWRNMEGEAARIAEATEKLDPVEAVGE